MRKPVLNFFILFFFGIFAVDAFGLDCSIWKNAHEIECKAAECSFAGGKLADQGIFCFCEADNSFRASFDSLSKLPRGFNCSNVKKPETQKEILCRQQDGKMNQSGTCMCPSGDNLTWDERNMRYDTFCMKGSGTAAGCKPYEALDGHAEFEDCERANTDAASDCQSDKASSNYGSGGTLGNLGIMAGQITSMSAQAACSEMGKVAQAANAGLATFKTMCGTAIAQCQQLCTQAKSRLNRAIAVENSRNNNQCNYPQAQEDLAGIDENLSQCKGKEQNIAQADQAAKSVATTFMQSQNCADQFAATKTDICKTYPDIAGCKSRKLDCTIAENKKTQQCICDANARDPKCTMYGNNTNINQKPGSNSGNSANLGSTSVGANSSKLNTGDPFGGTGEDEFNGKVGPSTSKSQGTGSGSGAGGFSGDSGSGDSGGLYGESDEEGPSTAVGTAKGGSGGGGYSYGSRGGSDSDGGSGGYGSGERPNTGVDLRKYLPGGALDPKRKIAGAVGPDGITCSSCGTLFQKVTTRYNMVKGSMHSAD